MFIQYVGIKNRTYPVSLCFSIKTICFSHLSKAIYTTHVLIIGKVTGTLQPCHFCMGEFLHKKSLLYAELEITARHSHFPANSCPGKTHFGRCLGKTRILACAQFISRDKTAVNYLHIIFRLQTLLHRFNSFRNFMPKFTMVGHVLPNLQPYFHYRYYTLINFLDPKFQD